MSQSGAKLKIVAYLHDQVAIKQILNHLGLSPPEDPKPPPAVHEVVRVPLDEELRRASYPSRAGLRGMLRARALLITLGDAC